MVYKKLINVHFFHFVFLFTSSFFFVGKNVFFFNTVVTTTFLDFFFFFNLAESNMACNYLNLIRHVFILKFYFPN